MNFNLPTTLGDWAVIVAAIVVTHIMFTVGSRLGFWGTDPKGHITLGSQS